jgi:quercetin dioxygenase-like cupin family protein
MIAGALALTALGSAARAEPPTPQNTPSKPAPGDPYAAFFPDNTHIPFFTPDAIPWKGTPGREQQYLVYGDTKQPGPYALMLRWYPGSFSKPHFHGKPRYIVVLSGTWWVSSSNKYDPAKTYPLRAGSVVSDELNTVHWDGAKDEPVTLLIVGEGPVPNVNVDEDGKPINKNNF